MRHATRSLGIVAFLLVAPALLSGCLSADEDSAPARDLKEGHGLVTIWVNKPLGMENYPIKDLIGVPRLVAFVAGSNETKAELGPGFTDIAKGWPAWWADLNHTDDQWPASAEQDWTKRSAIWYQGQVPTGEYSVIRIEIVGTHMTFLSGGRGDANVQGGRLSFAPGDGDYFVVEEGEELVLAADAKLEEQGHGDFIIR